MFVVIIFRVLISNFPTTRAPPTLPPPNLGTSLAWNCPVQLHLILAVLKSWLLVVIVIFNWKWKPILYVWSKKTGVKILCLIELLLARNRGLRWTILHVRCLMKCPIKNWEDSPLKVCQAICFVCKLDSLLASCWFRFQFHW